MDGGLISFVVAYTLFVPAMVGVIKFLGWQLHMWSEITE